MRMFKFRLIFPIISLLIWPVVLRGAEFVLADALEADNKSFTFSVSPHALSSGGTFVVGASEVVADNDYTLAQAGRAGNFTALAPTKVTLNGAAEKVNPLRGKKINHLALLGNYIVVVGDHQPQQLYLQQGTTSISMLSTLGVNLHDAGGNDTAGIAAIEGALNRDLVFAAVAPSGGSFGDADGGITVVRRHIHKITENGKDKTTNSLDLVDASAGTSGGNKAAKLDVTTSAVQIGSDLASLGSVIDMHWDNHLRRLYVALQTTAGVSVTDGSRAIVVGRLTRQDATLNKATNVYTKLVFDPIAPAAVFSGTDKIVGATGAGTSVSIHKVRTMRTSTKLSYLIVSGGNGAVSVTGNTVFALPLVDKNTSTTTKLFDTNTTHGTLAVANQPTSFFASTGAFAARAFTTQIVQAADALTSADAQTTVGGGALPLDADQTITDLVVVGDAVYVSISQSFSGDNEPGIFHSQAIFDDYGRIACWTSWARAAGVADRIFGMAYDSIAGLFWYMSGTSATSLDTIKRTVWGEGKRNGLLGGTTTDVNKGMIIWINGQLPQAQGGIHGLFDFPYDTPTFGSTEKLSMIVGTGLDKIVLAETARDTGGSFVPNTGDLISTAVSFSNGVIGTTFANSGTTKLLAISGGDVTKLGAIVAAEIATDGTNGWLFVGGSDGLGVLANDDGTGWQSELHAGFGGIASGMKIKEIGGYSFVRKIISDGQRYLYVLTNDTFERIDLTSANLATGQLDAMVLMRATGKNTTFSDAAVSGRFALLATSRGLLRVGNGADVRTGTQESIGWTRVDIGAPLGPVTRLLFATTTGHERDFATKGQLFALSAYVGFNDSQVNRFYINDDGAAIDGNTMLPLPDVVFKDDPIFFVNFGSYRNYIGTNGALILNSRSRNQSIDPVLGRLPNQRLAGAGRNLHVPFEVENALRMGRAVRSSGSGSWLVPGDRLRVNE